MGDTATNAARAPGRTARQGVSVRRVVASVALGVLGLATLLLVQVWWLSGRAPSWWTSAAEVGPDAPRRADALERGFSAAVHDPARSGPWQVDFSERDANAWLAERLPRWLANRDVEWPGGVSTPRVHFDRERITLGVALGEARGARVASLSFRVLIGESGEVRLDGAQARIGMVAMPALPGEGTVRGLVESLGLDDATAPSGEPIGVEIVRALRGERPVVDDAALTLEDGRRVRLLEARPIGGRLRLTCVTEPARVARD